MHVFLSFLLFAGLAISTSLARAQQAPQLARDYVYGPGGRLVVTMEPDNYPPSTPPEYVSAAPGQCAIDGVSVSWGAATDIGSGVALYRVYRDGGYGGDFAGFSFQDYDVMGGMGYSYWVSAIDNAGHEGEMVGPASVYIPLCFTQLFQRWLHQSGSRFAHVHLIDLPSREPSFVAWAVRRPRVSLPRPMALIVGGGGGGQ